jgi:hypothetical protein
MSDVLTWIGGYSVFGYSRIVEHAMTDHTIDLSSLKVVQCCKKHQPHASVVFFFSKLSQLIATLSSPMMVPVNRNDALPSALCGKKQCSGCIIQITTTKLIPKQKQTMIFFNI